MKVMLLFILFVVSIGLTAQEKESKFLAMLEQGKFLEAVNAIDYLISKEPENQQLYLLKAYILVESLKDYKSGIAVYEKISQEAMEYDSYLAMGHAYRETGEFQKSIAAYNKAVNLDPRDYRAQHAIGVIYANHLSNDTLALKFYSEAYELMKKFNFDNKTLPYKNSDFSRVLFALGNTHYKLQQFNESVQFHTESLSYDSLFYGNILSLGNNYLRLGNMEKALFYYDNFLENEPLHKFGLNGKANAHFALGDTENACKNWKLALENGYVFQQKWKKIFDIENPEILIQMHCN